MHPQMRLHSAASAGNTAALLSLADRYFTGEFALPFGN